MTHTKNTVSDADWHEEAARYFENRDTGGEDMAFWANVSNAERCRSIAQSLRASIPGGVGVKPRLTDAAIRAACKAHFGTENVDGVCVTVKDRDWSFREAFKRMWHGAWSALDLSPAEGEPVAMTAETACKIAIDAIKGVPGYGDLKSEETGRDDDWRFRARLARSEALSSAHARIKLAFEKVHAAPSNPVISDERIDEPFAAHVMRLISKAEQMVGYADLTLPDAQVAWTKWRDERIHVLRLATAALSVKPQSGSDNS